MNESCRRGTWRRITYRAEQLALRECIQDQDIEHGGYFGYVEFTTKKNKKNNNNNNHPKTGATHRQDLDLDFEIRSMMQLS
jgi:hypothetical protein